MSTKECTIFVFELPKKKKNKKISQAIVSHKTSRLSLMFTFVIILKKN